jgi:hypothetical protein
MLKDMEVREAVQHVRCKQYFKAQSPHTTSASPGRAGDSVIPRSHRKGKARRVTESCGLPGYEGDYVQYFQPMYAMKA